MFFKHFASKIQLPGLPVSGTLVENGLNTLVLKVLRYMNPVKVLIEKLRKPKLLKIKIL